LCRVSLAIRLAKVPNFPALAALSCASSDIDTNAIRVKVGVRCNSREVEIRDDQEECCACDEDIVVVLCGSQWPVILASVVLFLTSLMLAKAVGPASVMPTLTMKCDAAARPITFDRKVMGRTSAPYLQC
jgi:hypothetical protein